jgi:copper oxidase (laccase) domain-containing protein
VTRCAVDELVDAYGCDTADLWAAVGPSIGPDSYEVGPEVVHAARAVFGEAPVVRPARGDRSTFDLWAANVELLRRAGIDPARISVAGVDTRRATDEFFSDRAARPCGRLMAVARLGTAG